MRLLLPYIWHLLVEIIIGFNGFLVCLLSNRGSKNMSFKKGSRLLWIVLCLCFFVHVHNGKIIPTKCRDSQKGLQPPPLSLYIYISLSITPNIFILQYVRSMNYLFKLVSPFKPFMNVSCLSIRVTNFFFSEPALGCGYGGSVTCTEHYSCTQISWSIMTHDEWK